MTEFRWVVIPDLQVPSHDKRAVASTLEFIRAYKPDGLLCVGDEIDSPETSKWTKGMAGEYSGTLQAAMNDTHDVLAAYRAALGNGKPFHLSRSNHSDRTETYVRRYAPALGSIDALRIDSLLGLAQLDITHHRVPYEFHPNWVLLHGDEAGYSSQPGKTALNLAIKLGKSVVIGHTHSAAIIPHSTGVNGKGKTIYGMECGHLMSMSMAHYLKTGAGNWQQAVGVIVTDGPRVSPQLIYIQQNGKLYFNGKWWG